MAFTAEQLAQLSEQEKIKAESLYYAIAEICSTINGIEIGELLPEDIQFVWTVYAELANIPTQFPDELGSDMARKLRSDKSKDAILLPKFMELYRILLSMGPSEIRSMYPEGKKVNEYMDDVMSRLAFLPTKNTQ